MELAAADGRGELLRQPTPGGYPNALAHPDGAGGYLAAWQNIANAPSGTYTLR